MKEEDRKITLGLGDVSLSQRLGCYYIDMRPARVHYERDIYGGGFDERGAPMIRTPEGRHYMPVNVLQYGFMLHADWLENGSQETLAGLRACLEVLEEEKSIEGDAMVWRHPFRQPKYDIPAGWASGMAQGQAISFYLRMYQALEEESLLETAWGAYRFLALNVEEGGVRRLDSQGNLWFEEFPSREPSFVLNGFIYTILGLFDLWRITRDEAVMGEIHRCLETLRGNLHRFDVGYWSLYDLQKEELVRYYYQKNVHVPQMAVLYALTDDPIFKEYQEKWESQITPLNFLFVRLMYRIKPRMDRIRKVWHGT